MRPIQCSRCLTTKNHTLLRPHCNFTRTNSIFNSCEGKVYACVHSLFQVFSRPKKTVIFVGIFASNIDTWGRNIHRTWYHQLPKTSITKLQTLGSRSCALGPGSWKNLDQEIRKNSTTKFEELGSRTWITKLEEPRLAGCKNLDRQIGRTWGRRLINCFS